MKFATVFATCFALALARSYNVLLPVARDIPQTDASELPVSVAHDFIRRFGFVKPSDDDILEYADTVGIDVASGLRGLYTDPALVLLEDDHDNTVAYYADNGVNLISTYPETRVVLRSLLDASNAVALVYRPEKYLSPSEREATANRFFSPANFKLRDIDADVLQNVRVVDAPVVFRELEIPVLYPRSRPSYPPFDIDRIPNAYKAPVYLRLSDHAIRSDSNPIDADSTYPHLTPGHAFPSREGTPRDWLQLCQIRPWWCQSYQVLESNIVPLRHANSFIANPVPHDTNSFKLQPNTERYKTIPSSVTITSNPPLPLVVSKNIPLVKQSTNIDPATGDFVKQRVSSTNIPTVSNLDASVVSHNVIHPEQLKSTTIPDLSTVTNVSASNNIPIVSNVNAPVIPPYVILAENLKANTAPVLSTTTNIPTTNIPTASDVNTPIISPNVIYTEQLKSTTVPDLSTVQPTINTLPVTNPIPSSTASPLA